MSRETAVARAAYPAAAIAFEASNSTKLITYGGVAPCLIIAAFHLR